MRYFVVIVCIFFSFSVFSQVLLERGTKIDGENQGDFSGASVSLSSDGTVIAIGSTQYMASGYRPGKVRVYKHISGSWTKLGNDIEGEGNTDRFGHSVSLSDDGTIVAIGAPLNDGSAEDAGHVRVYQYNTENGWTQLGSDIDGEADNDQSGQSVSLSSDGTKVAIGAVYNDGNGTKSGHVRVYQYANNTWTQVGSDIDGEAAGDESGYSVSLSSDGNKVAIGAPYHDANNNNYRGHVRVYDYSNNSWTKVGADIDGGTMYSECGFSVSLSSDGTKVAIGSPGTAIGGAVRLFEYANNSWTQLGNDIGAIRAGDTFGHSVSLSGDGSRVVIGGPQNDDFNQNAGHARVYDYANNSWTQLGGYDVPDLQLFKGEDDNVNFGAAVSISRDGSTFTFGSTKYDRGAGGADGGRTRIYHWQSTPVTVKKDGSGSFTTIQGAVDAVITGAISVSAGTYEENIAIDDKSITLKSSNGPDSTIIKPSNNSVPILWLKGAKDLDLRSTIEGFTLKDAGNPSWNDPRGSALKITNSSSATVINVIFADADNQPFGASSNGTAGSVKLYNCIFYGTKRGETFFDNDGNIGLEIYNSVFANNAQAGINYSNPNYNPVIKNSIFYNNDLEGTGQKDVFGSVDISYSIYDGGTGNNLSVNPNFVDPANNNFRLSGTSPAIGAGNSSGTHPTDILGNARPNPANSNPDMGAYENALSERQEGVTLSVDKTMILENADVSTIKASLSAAINQDVVVSLSVSGTATGNGTDYTLSSNTITIPSGSTTATATLTSIKDGIVDNNETVILAISSVTNAAEVGTQEVTITINDLYDSYPDVSLFLDKDYMIEGTSGVRKEGRVDGNISILSSFPNDITVSFDISGTASNGDYKIYGSFSDFSYTNWSAFEPNNIGGNENYAYLSPFGDCKWLDKPIDDHGNPQNYLLEVNQSINTIASTDPNQSYTYLGEYQGHSYFISKNKTNFWTDARDQAYKDGGYLAIITSKEEQNAICSWSYNELSMIGLYQDVDDDNYSEPNGGWRWIAQEMTEPFQLKIPAGKKSNDFYFLSSLDNTTENDETIILDIESILGGNEAGGSQKVTITIIDDDDQAPRGFDDSYQVGQGGILYVDFAGDSLSGITEFPFDGNLNDASENILGENLKVNGSNQAVTYIPNRFNTPNKALKLYSNSIVKYPADNDRLNFKDQDEFSIALWYKYEDVGTGSKQFVLAKLDGYNIFNDGNQYVDIHYSGGGGDVTKLSGRASVWNEGGWNHVVLTAKPSANENTTDFNLYINGNLEKSSNKSYKLSSFLPSSYFPLYLGANHITEWEQSGYTYQGGIDDLTFHQKALSTAEILDLYNSNTYKGVLKNDFDFDGDAMTATLVTTTSNGTLTFQDNGGFKYEPNQGFSGTDSFTYKVSDGTNLSTNITVTISISTPPIANNDNYSVNEDAVLVVDASSGILVNDTDSESDAMTAVKLSDPTYGTLLLNPNGSFSYDHDGGGSTSDSFTYQADDGIGTSDTAKVTFTITPTDDAPVATKDSYGALLNQTLVVPDSLGVLANDSDEEGNAMTAVLVTDVKLGTLDLSANGGFSYQPPANNNVVDSFEYKVQAGNLFSNNVFATISVNNKPVIAANQVFSINENSSKGTQVGQISITDESSSFTWEILSGNDKNLFIIDQNGNIKVENKDSLDYEKVKKVTLNLRANDGSWLSDAVDVVININNVQDMAIISSDVIHSYCSSGSGTGSITLVVEGQEGSLKVSWNSGQTTLSITDLSSGSYQVTLEDSVGQTLNASYTVNQLAMFQNTMVCYVSSDSADYTRNRVFVKTGDTFYNVDKYRIYREGSSIGVYDLIGEIDALTDDNFLDTLSDNRSRGYKYKVSMVDKCGSESNKSASHTTHHLVANQGISGEINLNWSKYLGFPFGTYEIFRSVDNGSFEKLDAVSSDVLSYSDFTVSPESSYKFYISVAADLECRPQGGGGGINIYEGEHSNVFGIGQGGKKTRSLRSNTFALAALNNSGPTIGNQVFSIQEKSANGTEVGTIAASDADNDPLAFTITGGSGESTFALEESTGKLTVKDNAELDLNMNASLKLTVKVSDGSSDASAEMTINITSKVLAIEEVASQIFNVYPIPAQRKLKVVLKDNVEVERIEFIDYAGKLIAPKHSKRKDNTLTLDVSNLYSGIYILNLVTEKGTSKARVVIER